MIASTAMQARVTWVAYVRMAVFAGAMAGCGHTAKLAVDSPILPYQKPDVSEITGIDDDEEAAALQANDAARAGGSAAPAPAPEKK